MLCATASCTLSWSPTHSHSQIFSRGWCISYVIGQPLTRETPKDGDIKDIHSSLSHNSQRSWAVLRAGSSVPRNHSGTQIPSTLLSHCLWGCCPHFHLQRWRTTPQCARRGRRIQDSTCHFCPHPVGQSLGNVILVGQPCAPEIGDSLTEGRTEGGNGLGGQSEVFVTAGSDLDLDKARSVHSGHFSHQILLKPLL